MGHEILRRVKSWDHIPPTGFSPEGKMRRVGSCEQLATVERVNDLGLAQQKQPPEEDDDVDEGLAREISRLSTEGAFREQLFRRHPDIIRISKKEEVDLDSAVGKLKERLLNGQDCSEDSDIDDEQFYVPNKSGWLKICADLWGMKDDDALRSQVRATEMFFEIFTAGFYSEDGDSGCGAIVKDSCHRPIVAKSKVISQGKCVSPFYVELEGIALGVKLAKEYHIFPFYLHSPSEYVSVFVSQNWNLRNKCYCSGTRKNVDSLCKACSESTMFPEDYKDHEKALQVVLGIFSDIQKLQNLGLPWFNVGYGGRKRNEAAYFLAKLRKDKELKVKEIGKSEELWDAIYEEVFGQYIELPW